MELEQFMIPDIVIFTQHPLWNRLIKDHQEMGVLVEGPLNNLRKNEMHVSKPLKLYNKRNPVSCVHLIVRHSTDFPFFFE